MKYFLVAAAAALSLSACTTPPTQAQIAAGATLASMAAANSPSVAALLSKGALLCGEAVSPSGELLAAGAVLALNAAGVPISVTGALAETVADSCSAVGLVPGAMPANVDPAAIPALVIPSTKLPAIS